MTSPTTSLPSLGQWRLINLLAIRSRFTAERRASQMMNRTDARPSDLGELAEDGWITGHTEQGDDVNLAENWSRGLAYVYLRLTAKGLAWYSACPHNVLLHEIADVTGAYRMKPAEVDDKGEVLQQLIGRRLIVAETDDGVACTDVTPPSRQVPGETLYVRLTKQGQSIVNP